MLYPELQNAPEECALGPLPSAPIPISVPYGNVEIAEGVMMQGAMIPASHPARQPLNRLVNQVGNEPEGGNTIGYASDAELGAINILRPIAASLRNNTAFYEAAVRDRVVQLADMALGFLNDIVAIYRYFEESPETRLTFKSSSPRGAVTTNVSLSQPEVSFAGSVDATKTDQFWVAQRQSAREEIRGLWDRALWDLWCAEVGANQSRSYRANRQAYNDRPGPQVGPGVLLPGQPSGPSPGFVLVPGTLPPGPGPGPDPEPAPLPGGFADWGPVPLPPDPGPAPDDFPRPDAQWGSGEPVLPPDVGPSPGFDPDFGGDSPPDTGAPPQGVGVPGTSRKRRRAGGGGAIAVGVLLVGALVVSQTR